MFCGLRIFQGLHKTIQDNRNIRMKLKHWKDFKYGPIVWLYQDRVYLAFLLVCRSRSLVRAYMVHVNWVTDSYFIWFILFFEFNPLFFWSVCVSNDISFYRFIKKQEKAKTTITTKTDIFFSSPRSFSQSFAFHFISFHCIYISLFLVSLQFLFQFLLFRQFSWKWPFCNCENPMFFRHFRC